MRKDTETNLEERLNWLLRIEASSGTPPELEAYRHTGYLYNSERQRRAGIEPAAYDSVEYQPLLRSLLKMLKLERSGA